MIINKLYLFYEFTLGKVILQTTLLDIVHTFPSDCRSNVIELQRLKHPHNS